MSESKRTSPGSCQGVDASERRKIQAEEAYVDALNFFVHGEFQQAQAKISESTELWSENKIFQTLKARIVAAVNEPQVREFVAQGWKYYAKKEYSATLDAANSALRLDPTNAGALALKNQAEISLSKRSEASESSYLEIIERLRKELEQANQKIADWEQKSASFEASAKPSKTQAPPPPIVTPSVSKSNVDDSWIGNYAGERREIKIQDISYGFCYCPSGTFIMGSPKSEEGHFIDETQHKVTLTRGFWMLETPVTQGLWTSVIGKNPSWFCSKGDGFSSERGMDTTDFPVENVSWDDCQEFIEKLNDFNLIPSHKFRLPTEAEWEYACRAGTTTAYWWGDSLNGDHANCNGSCPYGTKKKGRYLDQTCAVKSYGANPWGLYDVHGNVWEWCSDGDGYYPDGDITDPKGDDNASDRVLRGGGWDDIAGDCRSAFRSGDDPECRSLTIGFRFLLE